MIDIGYHAPSPDTDYGLPDRARIRFELARLPPCNPAAVLLDPEIERRAMAARVTHRILQNPRILDTLAKRLTEEPEPWEPATVVSDPEPHFGDEDWCPLPDEPCRSCREVGGVQFLASTHPLDQAAQAVRCTRCKAVWDADGSKA